MRHRVRVRSCRRIYQGRIFRLDREELEVDGRRFLRETIVHPGAAVIVPVLDRSRIVLVRQYRHPIRQDLLELPAGTLEPGEPVTVCARRELAEETGWWPRYIRRIARFYAAPGYTTERLTIFLARGLRRVDMRPDADEFLIPVVLSYRSALTKIQTGAICDAKTIIGILLARPFVA